MEPTGPTRLILPLMKCRVTERTEGMIKIAIGGSTTVTIFLGELSDVADVKAGDVLTLYTEVLYANPGRTSIQ